MTMFTRTLAALAVVVIFAAPALAGPPLICFPFQTDGGKLIAWGAGSGWNTPDRSYDIKRLITDTNAVLTGDAPILTRMENLRRATIYAQRDPEIADALLKSVMGRALGTTTDARAWFDAGYLIESYRQVSAIQPRNAGSSAPRYSSPIASQPEIDGLRFVEKALELAGSNPEMEFAASLMKEGSAADAHRQRAVAGARPGSLLAKNLAR